MSHGHALLLILSDGRFHSGEALGRSLGVGRAAVWKSLHALKDAGMPIHAVSGRGYRLAAPLELLSVEAIEAAMPAAARARLGPVELHFELDSTNTELLRRAAGQPSGTVCLAEGQRAGRGRQGRRWSSPCACNLYLSLLWRFPRGPDALAGLALVVGLAVLRALDDAGVEGAGVKWPNDIVWRGAKLAGTLIEMSGESGGASCVVIGIGINVNMPRDIARAEIAQPWVDVATARGATIGAGSDADVVSRNFLAASVLQHLVAALSRFEAAGLAAFMEEWDRRDVLRGRAVAIHRTVGDGIRKELGTARGVDADGALLVERRDGIQRYLSGDVSVRARRSNAVGETLS